MSEYPKMLYKPGDAFEWEGMKLGSLIVADAEAEVAAFADGWLTADLLGNEPAPLPQDAVVAPRRGRPPKVA